MQTITDLLSTQTKDQIRAGFVNLLVSVGIRADLWRKGGTFSTLLTYIAAFLAAFQALVVQAIGFGFLPSAAGGWLTLLAFYFYGVTRPEATFATGPLTLTNSGGASFSYAPGQATFYSSRTKKTYVNVDAIALGPLSTQAITIRATDTGSGSNADPSQVDSLQTTMLKVTVSNPAPVRGLDAMLDPDLRTMCTNRLGASSVRGPRNAYAYAVQVAVSPTTGAPVNINRLAVSESSHTGVVTVWIASPTGAPTGDDIAGVVNSIQTGVPGLVPSFSGVRPNGVSVSVVAVTPVAYTSGVVVWASARPGLAAGDLGAAVAAAIDDFFATYPIGGFATESARGLFGSRVERAIEDVDDAIFKVEDVNGDPLPDLALADGQAATDLVTSVTVRLVA